MIDGTPDMNEDEILLQVFGSEKYKHVHGYKMGITPSNLFGSSSNVCDLECSLNESKQYLQESEWQRKAEVQALKYQISKLENRFEDRFQTMMAEMRKYVIKFQLSFCLLLWHISVLSSMPLPIFAILFL